MNPKVDAYLGRAEKWQEEMETLRRIVLDFGFQVRFTGVQEILELEAVLKAYIHEAIEVEKAGLKVELKKTSDFKIPGEFQTRLDEIPALKTAFESLTPGRQRAYIYHFSQAKQTQTRESRVEKCIPLILSGKGLNDFPKHSGRIWPSL